MTAVDLFREAMRTGGLGHDGVIIADGRLHRFRAAGDSRPNSWYVLHEGPPTAGGFGCWKRSIKHTWCDRHIDSLTSRERKLVQESWRKADEERQREAAHRQARARTTAAWVLTRSQLADPSHGYLQRKRVQPHGNLRMRFGRLVLPLSDANGVLHSLQFIDAGGTKRFLPGGHVGGSFFTVSDKADGPLVIAEGYATAASIAEATGGATVAALNCGNLLPVAKSLRERFPDRELIIAADDDRWNSPGENPGVAKATEAAKAVRARLVVPRFQGVTTEPTDFNDLALLEGPVAVASQIAAARFLEETPEETYARLAALTPTAYDRVRKAEAVTLGIRSSTLDREVEARRETRGEGHTQGSPVTLPTVEPWPETVDGAEVLAEIAETISRYVALPSGGADALALWCAHAHVFTAFLHTPRVNLFSPEKGCGKTTLLDVISTLVPRPLRTESITAAVLFRLVDAQSPTLLLDEVDTYLRDAEELRGLLNAGHKRGARAYRCEGETNTVRGFDAFAPAVLAGIGHLPGTLHDRSIVIRLVRAKPAEVLQRFDSRKTDQETVLCRKLSRWGADYLPELERLDPELPAGAYNRVADNWRPLFAIATIAGGDWPDRARRAFDLLNTREDLDAQGVGVMLLADIKTAFLQASGKRMFSKSLAEALVDMADRPWAEIRKGRPLNENWLGHRLRAFGVSSRTLRIGTDRAKGYELDDLADAFDRYLPSDASPASRDGVTEAVATGAGKIPEHVTPAQHVTHEESEEDAAGADLSRCHVGWNGAAQTKRELVEEVF